jgi:maleate isomerase
MERFRARRYALATPYLEMVNEAIVRTLERQGLKCVHHVALGITVNREFNEVPLDRIRQHVLAAWRPSAEAILVLCTNFPAARACSAADS